MKNQNELFIVEHENGEWVETSDGGWSCWTTLAEAQDALDSEADNCEDQRIVYKIVRFVREPVLGAKRSTTDHASAQKHIDTPSSSSEGEIRWQMNTESPSAAD